MCIQISKIFLYKKYNGWEVILVKVSYVDGEDQCYWVGVGKYIYALANAVNA